MKLFKKQILRFYNDNTKTNQRFKQALQNNKYDEIFSIAHILKSSSGWIGAVQLSKIANNIEKTAKSQNQTILHEQIDLLSEELNMILNSIMKNNSKIKPPSSDNNNTNSAIQQNNQNNFIALIDQIIDSFNVDITTTLLLSKKLNNMIQDSELKEEYKIIYDYIELLELDKALEAIKIFRNQFNNIYSESNFNEYK